MYDLEFAIYSYLCKTILRSPSVICRALTRLLDESITNMESIDAWEKLTDAYLSLGVRTCDNADKEVERIEDAGKRLATTMTAEDVDVVVGPLLGRIGEIRKKLRSGRKDEL